MTRNMQNKAIARMRAVFEDVFRKRDRGTYRQAYLMMQSAYTYARMPSVRNGEELMRQIVRHALGEGIVKMNDDVSSLLLSIDYGKGISMSDDAFVSRLGYAVAAGSSYLPADSTAARQGMLSLMFTIAYLCEKQLAQNTAPTGERDD